MAAGSYGATGARPGEPERPAPRRRARPAVLVAGVALAALSAAAWRRGPSLAARAPPPAAPPALAQGTAARRSARSGASDARLERWHKTAHVRLERIACGDAEMKLACHANLTVYGDSNVTLAYRPYGTGRAWLWTRESAVFAARGGGGGAAAAAASSSVALVPMLRLRPRTDYELRVYVQPQGGGYALQATRNFTSASTPFALFDEGPVGELLGPIPSFDVVMTDLEATDGSFEGVVMIDNEGYVVWYFDAGEKVEAFDQFPGPECVAWRRRRRRRLARVRARARARARSRVLFARGRKR